MESLRQQVPSVIGAPKFSNVQQQKVYKDYNID